MKTYTGLYIGKVFKDILSDLWNKPEYITCPRGMEVREIRDCCICIKKPMENLGFHEQRSSPLKYIAAEILWYFSGTNDPTFIENYASLWKKLHNEDDTVNSAYGNLIFQEKTPTGLTQYQWVIESLKKDKDSRQAFMHFNKPPHQYLNNKDQVCTLNAIFHIRENKLHMTLTMRSNDIIYGFMTDWAFFSILQYQVYNSLKAYYPKLTIGSYTHISHSMHVYERHYSMLRKMFEKPWNNGFKTGSIPLSNTNIVDETGKINKIYFELLMPIFYGKKPDFNNIPNTNNDLLNWCIEQLKEEDHSG